MKIMYVDDVVAVRVKEYIYLNKNLKEYPKLHDVILKHELDHTDKFFTWREFFMDLKPLFKKEAKNDFKIFKNNNKKAVLKQMLPYNNYGFNLNLSIMYIMIVALILFFAIII